MYQSEGGGYIVKFVLIFAAVWYQQWFFLLNKKHLQMKHLSILNLLKN